jgi:hypothetical protein
VAYQDGPHSRVTCVQCHIGPGAPWFVQSKLSGTRQIFAVALDSYPRPIPSPVEDLRPARDTCEQCHWPEKFHGDKVEARREYGADEENTEYVTMLRIHVGGGSDRLGIATGIHWHMSLANEIEYITTDERRQVIPWVSLKGANGEEKIYMVDGVTPEELALGERRRMDCMDCHNRPSHAFFPSADRAVDQAIALGRIDRGLPYIKREAVAALTGEYASQSEALQAIADALREFYSTEYPAVHADARPQLETAIRATQTLYRRNVFPRMNVSWGTYADHSAHMEFPGCFRCHTDEHRAQDGSVIRQDCELCHTIE